MKRSNCGENCGIYGSVTAALDDANLCLSPAQDLVAWINVGFLHIPHSEDIPNTVTVGNGVGFMLRPYNYFDDDPSMYSPDSVFFTSKQDLTSCSVNRLACLAKIATCLPNFLPFSYEGFQNLTRL